MTDSVNELTSVLPLTLQWVCCYSCGKVAGLVSQARAAPCKRAAEDVCRSCTSAFGQVPVSCVGQPESPLHEVECALFVF